MTMIAEGADAKKKEDEAAEKARDKEVKRKWEDTREVRVADCELSCSFNVVGSRRSSITLRAKGGTFQLEKQKRKRKFRIRLWAELLLLISLLTMTVNEALY